MGKLVPGATPMQSGVGTASIVLPCGVTVGAIAVVNACGDVYDIRNGRPLGFGRMKDGTPVLCESLLHGAAPAPGTPRITTGQNTTIAVVATDAVVTKAQAKRLATCAHDGLARAIRPVHTQMDGDTIFALGTGRVDADVNQIQLCAAAAEVMARAVVNAVAMGGTHEGPGHRPVRGGAHRTELKRGDAFLRRFFTNGERAYIASRGQMGAQSAAAMFAAKEVSQGRGHRYWRGHRALRNRRGAPCPGGAPVYRMTGAAQARLGSWARSARFEPDA